MVFYSTGVKELDDLFGGYRTTLIAFYGETGSAKTTLSAYIPILQITADLKSRYGKVPDSKYFVIIDTDGGFDYERLEEILQNNKIDPGEVLDHIKYWNVVEFDEQHKLIKDLPKTIKEEKWEPLLLTLDPIVGIYHGIILRTDEKYRAAAIGSYTGKIGLQLTTLRRLSVKYDCPAIATTWPQSPVGESMRRGAVQKLAKELGISIEEAEEQVPRSEIPLLGGREVGFLPKVIVELRVLKRDSPVREAVLFKHRSKPAGRRVRFKLCDAGIEGLSN